VKKFVWGKKLYILGGIVLFVALAFWIFVSFFLDDVLTGIAPRKLNDVVRVLTNGRFAVKIGKITYSSSNILCQKFELVRLHYDTSEQAITLKNINADSIYFTGVSLWDLVWGKEISMKSMQINTPKFTLTDAKKEQHSPDVIHDTIKLPVTSFDSIVLNDILVISPEFFHPAEESSLKGMRLKLTGFFFNPESLIGAPLLYSKQVDFALSSANYLSSDSMYVMQLRNLRASVADSLLTIDSISYKPNYSEDVFARKHRYQTGSVTLNCAKIRIEGINVRKVSLAGSVEFQKFGTDSWSVSTYLDRRRPADPHPAPIQLPNERLSSMPFVINADSIVLQNGKIIIREWAPGSLQPGMLFFDRAKVLITPVSNDSRNKNYEKPTHISLNAYFVGEALLHSSWTYPLHQKIFDLNIHATLGSFNVKKLNTWLMPFERLEVTDGILDSGKIEMNIRSGTAATTVIPYYRNFSVKILSSDVKKGRGLMEGFKTFWANTFVMRGNNSMSSPKIGTTTLTRTKDQDLMQFIWLSIRKSLGQVVGGFQ
jgi:hypothetical protein